VADKGQLSRKSDPGEAEIPPSPEVATFTLFFMAFSSVVGKELMDISQNPLLAQDKTILATYTHVQDESDVESDAGYSVPTTVGTSTINTEDHDEIEEPDEEEKEGVAEMKTTRPHLAGLLGDDDDDDDVKPDPRGKKAVAPQGAENGEVEKNAVSKPKESAEEGDAVMESAQPAMNGDNTAEGEEKTDELKPAGQPRSRFTTSLSRLQIEEARSHGRARLALAFEMLTMMKKRGLKTDPEAYQCLIDACGRVGDTKRATELLSRMHEDGIAADGVVYSCLVSAFSADSAWKQASGDSKQDEDLPGELNRIPIVSMGWGILICCLVYRMGKQQFNRNGLEQASATIVPS